MDAAQAAYDVALEDQQKVQTPKPPQRLRSTTQNWHVQQHRKQFMQCLLSNRVSSTVSRQRGGNSRISVLEPLLLSNPSVCESFRFRKKRASQRRPSHAVLRLWLWRSSLQP